MALRLKKTGVNVKAGDTIPYVICEAEGVVNGSSAGFAERAYHPNDIKRGDQGLKIGRQSTTFRYSECGSRCII